VIGNIGQDIYGEQILRDLERYQLDARGVEVTPAAPTGITVAIVRPDGERAFVSNLGSLLAFNEEMAMRHWDQAEDAGIICLVGLFMTPNLTYAAATRLLGRARQEGKLTMLDSGWDPDNWPDKTRRGFSEMLAETSIFLPNFDEARALTGKETPGEAAIALQALGPPVVVVKCGSQGSHLRVGELSLSLPAREVSVFDAVGAGDVFNSGFLYALRSGMPWETCLALGNSSASLYISRAENRFPSLDEVLRTARSTYPGVSMQGPVNQP
jgi:sugar/nucleoside kinase (ribokinase family)